MKDMNDYEDNIKQSNNNLKITSTKISSCLIDLNIIKNNLMNEFTKTYNI